MLHLALSMDPQTEMAEMRRLRSMAEAEMKVEAYPDWRWWLDAVELQAWRLKLLVRMGAENRELESGIRELLTRRKDGIRWSSTKTAALCVEVIIEAARKTGGFDFGDDDSVEVRLDAAGRKQTMTLDQSNL